MNVNPYEPPRPPDPQAINPYGQYAPPAVSRTPFVLAALGAWAASGYWALMTFLIGVGVMHGASSGFGLFFPVILIGLYAMRGFQIFKGDPMAIRRILWLHGVGALVAFSQAAGSHGTVATLQGLKVVINLAGLAAALWALRTLQRTTAPRGVTAPYAPPPERF